MNIIDTEETPNPAALKFVVEGSAISHGSKSFNVDDENVTYPLAKALFKIGATDIFLNKNCVSVTMFNPRAWEHFMEDVKQAIEEQQGPYDENAPKPERPKTVLDEIDKETFPCLPKPEKMSIVDSVFDELIRPSLANDGGGLELVDIEDHEVRIKYQGACGTCPSSVGGTLFAIQNILQKYVDPEMVVVSV